MKADKATVLVLGMAIAGTALAGNWNNGQQNGRSGGLKGNNPDCVMQTAGLGRPTDDRMNRELTVKQVETLAEARLIRMANDNLKVGEVEPTENGFTVTIVTAKSGDLFQTYELAKNGMPVQMMARFEARQARRAAMANSAN